jgi:hypothetical protein
MVKKKFFLILPVVEETAAKRRMAALNSMMVEAGLSSHLAVKLAGRV